MNKREAEGALACVGAIIGAGFVSGREVVSFFSRYGWHSWWLILLSAAVMMLLCALCMRRGTGVCRDNWCAIYCQTGRSSRVMAELCMGLLLCTIGGAMVSASGHMVMLAWPSGWAYPIGAVGTLCLAWLLGFYGIRPLSWLSAVLAAVFVASVFLLLNVDTASQAVYLAPAAGPGPLLWAALRAGAYGAMNLALAIGVVCKSRQEHCRKNDRQAVAFGLMLVLLLFMGNYLYLKHPELFGEAFPVVRLFSAFGRPGYVLSITLLYLAIFTTLVAILCALRGVAESRIRSRRLSALATLGVPLLVSLVGFEGIVDGLYAPVGLACLALVFLPLLRRGQTRNAQNPAPPLDK